MILTFLFFVFVVVYTYNCTITNQDNTVVLVHYRGDWCSSLLLAFCFSLVCHFCLRNRNRKQPVHTGSRSRALVRAVAPLNGRLLVSTGIWVPGTQIPPGWVRLQFFKSSRTSCSKWWSQWVWFRERWFGRQCCHVWAMYHFSIFARKRTHKPKTPRIRSALSNSYNQRNK